MPSNKCCVFGCISDKTIKKHVFPLDDDEFAMWVHSTGNEKIKGFSKEYVRKT